MYALGRRAGCPLNARHCGSSMSLAGAFGWGLQLRDTRGQTKTEKMGSVDVETLTSES